MSKQGKFRIFMNTTFKIVYNTKVEYSLRGKFLILWINSIGDPWHFGADPDPQIRTSDYFGAVPDPDPRIRTSD